MAIKEEDKGLTNVRQYDTYASYNADTERNDATISFVEQDNSVWVQGKQYSMNAECYVGSNKAAVSTTAWYLAGEATLAAGNDINIIGSVQRTLGNTSVLNNASYNGTGIFVLSIRSNGESATAVSRFQWLTKVGQVTNLRVVISGYNVKLYCQVAGGQYHFARISIFNQTSRITTNSKVLMKLSDNTTPETTDPVGTDIADVPYLLKSGGTVTGAVAFKEWVYNSKPINNKQGEYAHIAYNTRGTAGYVKVATITINYGLADEPIYFEIMQRKQPLAKLRLEYATSSEINPPLNTFTFQGTSVNSYYLHQTGSSVWDLYVRKVNAWTAITVSKVYIGGYSNGFYQGAHFTITYQDELVTAVPEGSVAATKATEYVNISGNATTAASATKLQNARKIGFANFDGTADVSLNAIQGRFQLRWTTNTTQWLRVIRFKTNAAYIKNSLVIAIQDIESFYFSGILSVYIGTTSNARNVSTRISWIALNHKNGDFSRAFRAYATYPTDTDEYVYVDIYVNSQLTYCNMQFNVLTVYDTTNLTIGNSGTWLEESAITGSWIHTSEAESSIVPKQSLFATDSAFMQSLEGLCHKSNDSSLNLRRRTEYICGQQVLSDTEEAGKAFYGSSANPLVISVPLKDPADTVAGGKVNVNLIRFYYADTYWQELFFAVNSPNIYTRWVANGNARPWYRIMKEDSAIEYNSWVAKATTANSAAVAEKTKYPLIVASGSTQFNWFADSTLKLSIPEEMIASVANGVFVMKVPEINVANEAKKVSNDLEIKVNGVQQVSFDGSSAKTVNIQANKTHFVKAANYGNGWTTPTAGATTPGIPLVLDTSFMIPLGQLMDGDTIIMQVPNTLTSTSTYPVYLQLDATEGIVTGNIVKIIKAQNAGTPVEWIGTTALTAGYYHFVYSEGAGGLIFMYRNVATS